MMDSDRELLELAAKAACYEIEWVRNSGCYYRCEKDASREAWDALDDDGDAFRLAVRLNFEIERSRLADRAYVGRVGEVPWVEYVSDDQDLYQTTRRCIVRAAAEIGRSMP